MKQKWTSLKIFHLFKGSFSPKIWNLTFWSKWETNDTNCSGGKHSCNRPHAHKLSLTKLILLFWTFYTSMKTFYCSFKIMHQKLPFTTFSSLSSSFQIFFEEEKFVSKFSDADAGRLHRCHICADFVNLQNLTQEAPIQSMV